MEFGKIIRSNGANGLPTSFMDVIIGGIESNNIDLIGMIITSFDYYIMMCHNGKLTGNIVPNYVILREIYIHSIKCGREEMIFTIKSCNCTQKEMIEQYYPNLFDATEVMVMDAIESKNSDIICWVLVRDMDLMKEGKIESGKRNYINFGKGRDEQRALILRACDLVKEEDRKYIHYVYKRLIFENGNPENIPFPLFIARVDTPKAMKFGYGKSKK